MHLHLSLWLNRTRLTQLLIAAMAGCEPLPAAPELHCTNIGLGELRITEFMADPSGTDTGRQYLELYDPSDRDIDLQNVVLSQSLADGSRSHSTVLKSGTILSGSYRVLGDTGDNTNARPPYINDGYGSELGALRHENGQITLRCGSTIIDEVSYAAVQAGHAWQLEGPTVPAQSTTEDGGAWCNAVEPLDELEPPGENFGSPGKPNHPCQNTDTRETVSDNSLSDHSLSDSSPPGTLDGGTPKGQCLAGSLRDPVPPKPGDLLISEIQSAPSSGNNGSGEWIEVLARADVDLNGLELANEGSGKVLLTSDDCLSIRGGDRLLFARSTDPALNGGLPFVTGVFGFTLADAASSTVSERAVVLRYEGAVIDRATWLKSTAGVSWQRSLDSTLAPDTVSAQWCLTSPGTTYGAGDRGTPGGANLSCEADVVDAGAPGGCYDSLGFTRPRVAPRPGDLMISEVMPSPGTGNNGRGEWFELRALASFDFNDVELANEGTGRTVLSSEACLSVSAGSWLLFARSSDASLNGQLPPVFATFAFTLADAPSTTFPERAVVVRLDGVELSRAIWTSSTRGRSMQLSFDSGMDAGSLAWCLTPNHEPLGAGDWGTPGTENVRCE